MRQMFRADFDEFVWRDVAGQVRFANRGPVGRRFLDRCVPVFSQPRNPVRRRRLVEKQFVDALINRSIMRAAKLAEARRIIPMNNLYAHQMKVEDAFRRNR